MKILFILASLFAFREAISDENTIYTYKTYEKFDLGDLEVKGSLLAPGDLSVRRRNIGDPHENFWKRSHFNDLSELDIKFLNK
jgi:hypothetical protein